MRMRRSFIQQRHPFHIPSYEHWSPFLNPWNEVKEQCYRRTSSITRRDVNGTKQEYHIQFMFTLDLNSRFPYPLIYFHVRYPFIYQKPEKGAFFGWSLPL